MWFLATYKTKLISTIHKKTKPIDTHTKNKPFPARTQNEVDFDPRTKNKVKFGPNTKTSQFPSPTQNPS